MSFLADQRTDAASSGCSAMRAMTRSHGDGISSTCSLSGWRTRARRRGDRRRHRGRRAGLTARARRWEDPGESHLPAGPARDGGRERSPLRGSQAALPVVDTPHRGSGGAWGRPSHADGRPEGCRCTHRRLPLASSPLRLAGARRPRLGPSRGRQGARRRRRLAQSQRPGQTAVLGCWVTAHLRPLPSQPVRIYWFLAARPCADHAASRRSRPAW